MQRLYRARKLYLPGGSRVFLCRLCHDLGYRSQQSRIFKDLGSHKKGSAKQEQEKALYREKVQRTRATKNLMHLRFM